eukprot:m.255821 g.255821  ORF g.255821 m.255821 type:complete len:397 (-) comp19706_c0_seq1:122-1312(-)
MNMRNGAACTICWLFSSRTEPRYMLPIIETAEEREEDYRQRVTALTTSDWAVVDGLLRALKPLHEALLTLTSNQHVAASLAAPLTFHVACALGLLVSPAGTEVAQRAGPTMSATSLDGVAMSPESASAAPAVAENIRSALSAAVASRLLVLLSPTSVYRHAAALDPRWKRHAINLVGLQAMAAAPTGEDSTRGGIPAASGPDIEEVWAAIEAAALRRCPSSLKSNPQFIANAAVSTPFGPTPQPQPGPSPADHGPALPAAAAFDRPAQPAAAVIDGPAVIVEAPTAIRNFTAPIMAHLIPDDSNDRGPCVQDELLYYRRLRPIDPNADPLAWWKSMAIMMPTLAQYALDVFTADAGPSPALEAFAWARRADEMPVQELTQFMFVHCNDPTLTRRDD